jgi:hypothetical protein
MVANFYRCLSRFDDKQAITDAALMDEQVAG